MRRQVLGVIEAIYLIEAFGDEALTTEDVQWAEEAADRRGCRLRRNNLDAEDRARLVELGLRCREWQKKH